MRFSRLHIGQARQYLRHFKQPNREEKIFGHNSNRSISLLGLVTLTGVNSHYHK